VNYIYSMIGGKNQLKMKEWERIWLHELIELYIMDVDIIINEKCFIVKVYYIVDVMAYTCN